ncbi:MAG: S53 family peptidase [Actinobacteria bacterium]|nr:S53 family peptidase [Actinomycetota bacterium]MBV8479041.1 S53 family peptidase [Actinomycetota bacterium]
MRVRVAVGAVLITALVLVAGAAARPADNPSLRLGGFFSRVCPLATLLGESACSSVVVTDANGAPLASGSPPAGAYGPAQFHGAYNLPSSSSSPTTIGIVDAYDDPTIESDLGVYDNYYGLPACTTANGCFEKVNQTGGTSYPLRNGGWALEISLDVETAHEICQNCKILLVEANSASTANLGASVNEAVKLGATVISNSYGGSESSSETSTDSYYNHPGVEITASSGDSGYGVEYPAASRYVTAVGGTTLNLGPNNTYGSESAWSSGGSGCSSYEAKPSWQTDSGCSHRTVADVSADADPNTGAAVYDSTRYQLQSGWFQVGGTSLSSPLIAGVYALAGNTTSVSYGSYPYSHTSALHDVTSGSNGSCSPSYLCTAGPGYDGPTGLGSPNGVGGF